MESTKRGINLESSLKRIAWAYGCAKKGSAEEAELGELLRAKVARGCVDGRFLKEIKGHFDTNESLAKVFGSVEGTIISKHYDIEFSDDLVDKDK